MESTIYNLSTMPRIKGSLDQLNSEKTTRQILVLFLKYP